MRGNAFPTAPQGAQGNGFGTGNAAGSNRGGQGSGMGPGTGAGAPPSTVWPGNRSGGPGFRGAGPGSAGPSSVRSGPARGLLRQSSSERAVEQGWVFRRDRCPEVRKAARLVKIRDARDGRGLVHRIVAGSRTAERGQCRHRVGRKRFPRLPLLPFREAACGDPRQARAAPRGRRSI